MSVSGSPFSSPLAALVATIQGGSMHSVCARPKSTQNNNSTLLRHRLFKISWVLLISLYQVVTVSGQIPAATIIGSVKDSNGDAIEAAEITVTNSENGFERRVTSEKDGSFRLENLQPGVYEVAVRSSGFAAAWRQVSLRIGDQGIIKFELQPGLPEQRVEVISEMTMNSNETGVAGVVTQKQIQDLPLNGRNFLELAQLEPGVNVTSVSNPGIAGNSYQRVNIAGGFPVQTRITVDGSTVTDRFVGGTMVNLSQESVQEFQISTFTPDPAKGYPGAGIVNIVTRRGSNALHGSGFFCYRDHNLSAYPGLARDTRNLDPFFARRQAGFSIGGPLKHDRFFWFTNYEHKNQDAVFSIANNHPVFSKLDTIYPSPLNADPFNVRLDAKLNNSHQAFLRYSSDWNNTLAPANAVGMPSNWQSVQNRGLQIQAGITSVLNPNSVNEVRLSYTYLRNRLDPISPAECSDQLACIGVGVANILVFDAPQFRIGNQANTPLHRWQRNYQIVDGVTIQSGTHEVRFGGEWEHVYMNATLAFNDPAQVTLWGPTNLQTPALKPLYDALPESLKSSSGPPPTLAEILQLPLRNFSTSVGDPDYPGPFNFDDASRNDRLRFYVQDSWRIKNNLTVTYGLAYSVETNLFDHDLNYPQYLAPLVGSDLHAPRRDLNNFDPFVGVAWSPGKSGRTIIRGGIGVYRDEGSFFWKARDRAFVGPSGNGRVLVDGSVTGLNFTSTPTEFRGADLVPLLPSIRDNLSSRFGDGSNLAIRGVEVIKQGDQILAPDVTTAYSMQMNVGIQRELSRNLILTADYVLRQYYDVGPLQNTYIIDRNRFNRPRVTGVNPDTGVVSFVRDPVIPLCNAAQSVALGPKDQCSTGPINIYSSGARYRYQGLHLTLDRRFSGGLQFLLGYAYSQDIGFFEFLSYEDPLAGSGNNLNHRRHKLTVSGVWTPGDRHYDTRMLRWLRNGWSVSFISQTFSATPLNAILTGLDLDGDGISRTLLPGAVYEGLGEEMTVSELRGLVANYNADVEARSRRVINPDGTTTIIRPRTPFNQIINPVNLPTSFSNGDSVITQDLRLTKTIQLTENSRMQFIAEVFNLFNVANLTGYSDVLNQPNYGQPSSRLGQVFGTGGPRAFQFGARLQF